MTFSPRKWSQMYHKKTRKTIFLLLKIRNFHDESFIALEQKIFHRNAESYSYKILRPNSSKIVPFFVANIRYQH